MVLKVENLVVRYGRKVALKDVSLELKEGLIYGLVGHNGAGKSTLLKAIAGTVNYEGLIALDGVNLSTLTPRERRELITYVPPTLSLMPELTVGDVMTVGLGSPELGRLSDVADYFEVSHLLERRVWEVSTGELSRALLARGLSRNSRVYLLDEPFSYIDIKHQLRLLKLLSEFRGRGKLVVIASNQFPLLLNYADGLIVLKNGAVVAQGPVREVAREEVFSKAFDVEVRVIRDSGFIDVIPSS